MEPAALRHLNLVRMIVNLYFHGLTRFGYDFEDLVQEGLLAVMIAEPKYDPTKGRESTFFARAVRHRISWRIYERGIRQHLRANFNAVSLDKPIPYNNEPGAYTLAGLLMDPAAEFEQGSVDQLTLKQALCRLQRDRPRESQAIRLRFWDELQLQEIGAALGVTRQRAEQLINQGLSRLRNYMDPNGGLTA